MHRRADNVHQRLDLVGRAAPVLGAEGIDGEGFDPDIVAGFDAVLGGFAPLDMPKTRGRPRCLAQRPLPSIMTAMWRGN